MPSELVQCLIFFALPKEDELDLDDLKEEIFAFLPEVFIKNHPEVLLVFGQNKIHVIRSEDKPEILAENDTRVLEYIEVFLDNSPSASLNPLLVLCDQDDASLLFHIFSETPIQLRRKRDEASAVKPFQGSQTFSNFLRKSFCIRYPVYKKGITSSICACAVACEQTDLIGLALDDGFDINDSDETGWTPLHWAAYNGRSFIVRTLIERGAIVDARTDDNATPLYLASEYEEVARILIENGADIHAKRNDGFTPLHGAASEGPSIAVIQLLIERGAVVDDRDNDDRTCLFYAESPEVVELLLHNAADPNALDIDKVTSIFLEPRVDVVRVLLNYGARVDIKVDDFSVLDSAWKQNHDQAFQYLIERCFLDPLLLSDFIKEIPSTGDDCKNILSRHVLKIQALNLQRHNFTNFDADRFCVSDVPAEFIGDCQVEVARMRSQTLCDTAVSVYDILEKNDRRLACLLGNDSIAQIAESDKWAEQYSIYGSILTCHFENGKLRRSLQEDGMRICSRLFLPSDRPLPDEIKDKIINYLSNDDIFNLKRAFLRSKS